MANSQDFISRYRHGVTAWLTALGDLTELKGQYDALDLGNVLTDDDFVGANADIVKADLIAAVASMDAINTFFLQGFHNTSLYKVKL